MNNTSTNNNNNDLSTVYTQGEVISDEGEAVDSLMKELETNLPAPKLMSRERGSSNPQLLTSTFSVSDNSNTMSV